MDFNEYQKQAKKTALYPKNEVSGLAYVALGLNGEAGEVAEIIKKIIRDENVSKDSGLLNKAIDKKLDDLTKELGDVLWYVASTCSELGILMENVAQTNIKKLQSRKERNVIKGSGDNR